MAENAARATAPAAASAAPCAPALHMMLPMTSSSLATTPTSRTVLPRTVCLYSDVCQTESRLM